MWVTVRVSGLPRPIGHMSTFYPPYRATMFVGSANEPSPSWPITITYNLSHEFVSVRRVSSDGSKQLRLHFGQQLAHHKSDQIVRDEFCGLKWHIKTSNINEEIEWERGDEYFKKFQYTRDIKHDYVQKVSFYNDFWWLFYLLRIYIYFLILRRSLLFT